MTAFNSLDQPPLTYLTLSGGDGGTQPTLEISTQIAEGMDAISQRHCRALQEKKGAGGEVCVRFCREIDRDVPGRLASLSTATTRTASPLGTLRLFASLLFLFLLL